MWKALYYIMGNMKLKMEKVLLRLQTEKRIRH